MKKKNIHLPKVTWTSLKIEAMNMTVGLKTNYCNSSRMGSNFHLWAIFNQVSSQALKATPEKWKQGPPLELILSQIQYKKKKK